MERTTQFSFAKVNGKNMMVKTNGYFSKEPEDSGNYSSESNNSTGLTPAIGKMVLPVERKNTSTRRSLFGLSKEEKMKKLDEVQKQSSQG